MLVLTNTNEQVLAPGQAITFDLTLLRTCSNAERLNNGTGNPELVNGNIFDIDFSANIAGQAAGQIELSVYYDGDVIPATQMISTPAAANELNNVARPGIKVRKGGCCKESKTITVRNSSTTSTIILPAKSARLTIKRDA